MGNITLIPTRSSLVFVAFFLLSGTYISTYGQGCPEITAAEQSFCDTEQATVGDLQAEETNVTWYATEDDTNPLSPETPLTNGTYYAGSPSGSCAGDRESVNVTILGPPEITGFQEKQRQKVNRKQSLATIEFCVPDLQNHNLTLENLRTNVTDVEWYLSNNPNASPIPETTPLEDDTYYYAAQINPDTGCRTTMVRTRIVLTVEEAPVGETTQEFLASANPTLADIETSEENRYYETEDSDIPLNSNTPLVDGATYYLSTWGEACESFERLGVTVVLISPPNAGGSTSGLVFCSDEDPVNLVDYIEDSENGPPDRDGTFEPNLEDNIFDPSQFEPGDYEFTYTVEGNDEYPDQTATINLTVEEAPDAGNGHTFYFCDVQGPQDLYALLESIGVTTEGTFDPHIPDGLFDPSVGGARELHLTYTVESAGNCPSDSATYIFLIREAPDPPQVTGLQGPACANQQLTVGDLETSGGEVFWYTDEELSQPAMESDLLVTGTYYATQINENACESLPAMVDVVINDAPTPTIEEGGSVFCTFDDPPTIADLEERMNGTNITWYDSPTGGNILSEDQLLQDGASYYASLTDSFSGCESSTRLEVPVTFERCKLPFPEAFSPNGDGINDYFEIDFAIEEFPNYSIEIFNRWGKKVFTGNASKHWDGTSEEETLGTDELPAGVYFYIFYFNDGQTEPAQGNIYLSR